MAGGKETVGTPTIARGFNNAGDLSQAHTVFFLSHGKPLARINTDYASIGRQTAIGGRWIK